MPAEHAVPVAVQGWTWTSSLMAIANLLIGGLLVQVVRTRPALKKIANEREANLLTEALALQLKTKAKHFSIGSLPAPIDIGGTFKHPSIRPDLAAVAARGGVAVALGIVGTPLAALIPTIQFGTDDKGVCSGLTRVETPPHVPFREPAGRTRSRRR